MHAGSNRSSPWQFSSDCDERVSAFWQGLILNAVVKGAQISGDNRYLGPEVEEEKILVRELITGCFLMNLYKKDRPSLRRA